jgi:cell pole-organizing protein PopZ
MEDILASIRRILSEDETPAGGDNPSMPPAGQPSGAVGGADSVLVLEPSMMVQETPRVVAEAPVATPTPMPPAPIAAPPTTVEEMPSLVAPEAAAAASSSVSTLMRTLAAERTMQVHSGGLTIEDIVREELRPMLKAWLDANLPSLVEHLVRAEIERLVSRAVP